jgi:hypothetical protein
MTDSEKHLILWLVCGTTAPFCSFFQAIAEELLFPDCSEITMIYEQDKGKDKSLFVGMCDNLQDETCIVFIGDT